MCLTSYFIAFMDISTTYGNPEPEDNPLLFSIDFVHHQAFDKPVKTLPLMYVTPKQPKREATVLSSDHESNSTCVASPSEVSL